MEERREYNASNNKPVLIVTLFIIIANDYRIPCAKNYVEWSAYITLFKFTNSSVK